MQAFQQLFSTPGTAGFNTAATNAGNAYTGVGNQSVGASGKLDAAALANLPGAQQVYQMGLDPQGALYKQQLQQTNDLANVTNAQYGLTGQQAAGNVNQADANFNIDWQNQQLQRALAGLSGATSAVSGVGSQLTQGQNVGAAGAGSILSGGATPYTTGQTIGANQETALQQYLSQLLGPTTSTEQTIGNLMQYLGLGVNASSQGASQGLANYYGQQSGAAGGATAGSSIGNAIAGLFNTQASSPQVISSNPVSSGSNDLVYQGFGPDAQALYQGF